MLGRQTLLSPGLGNSPRRTILTAFIPMDQLLSSASRVSQRSSSFGSSEEKYCILEQRDRLLREDQKRIVALDKAEALTGTCPDMCPEKERYLREIQSQLSPFEMLPGTDKVDHGAAIKEYSRSSTDLDKLLPHELRPLAVLSMTMDYIVTHIMDQGERNYQDWYRFVWNRTHGLRKDIIHQHLHDPQTVSLMEKCARFHIHCAHHLCEKPISTFDAPINKDQITKCLFTLKEMYLDLASEGTSCSREAEFQAYSILLALNQGDVLRQVQQLQPHIRKSPEVKFAIQAFTALNSNNYVRFFKLVHAASYLNACLLHGYFAQARGKALRTVTITHTVSSQKTTGFPLDRVVGWLLFNDSREAVNFIHHYGLQVSEGYIELNRKALREPKQPFRPKRSIFILKKLTTSVGQVVNGDPLPAMPQHVPENSFSPQGEYIGDRAEMVIARCWKSTMAVSQSGQRTKRRFLDPQESESAAFSSFLPFMKLQLPIIKRTHIFPSLGQNEKMKEKILRNEENWKTEHQGQKEFGWTGEAESRKEDDDVGWLEMQQWEGEDSESQEGQNGEVRKDQRKEDRDEYNKQGGRMKYGSGHVQENRKQEQGKEKEGRTWNREFKYEKIWEMPCCTSENRICLKRHIREMKGERKRGRSYEDELEVAYKRKTIAQNQGRKTLRHQERRQTPQEYEQLKQEKEKENSCERQSQREQGRTHRAMQEGGSRDGIWERKVTAEEEVEKWPWNSRELQKGKRKQKNLEEEKERVERLDQKRKSVREREHKYKERYGEKEVNWERGHGSSKTRKEGKEKGHSHKKEGLNIQCMTKKHEEGKKNENWGRDYREKQERKDGREERQCEGEKSREKRERKTWKLNFREKKEGRYSTGEYREDNQEKYWNRKGKNECEKEEIKMERENYKYLNISGREKRYFNEERVKWERQNLPRKTQEQYYQQRQENIQRLKEATLEKEKSKILDEDKWVSERKNRKVKYVRSREQGKRESKRLKREVWESNHGKECDPEDGELEADSMDINHDERQSSDFNEKLCEREYLKDKDNKIRKWDESLREINYNKQERKSDQELNEKSYRVEDLDGEKFRKKYPESEGKLIPDEWERKYRRDIKVDYNRSNREKVKKQDWAGTEKEGECVTKEPLELKRIPLKYLDIRQRENQEEVKAEGRGRLEGQRAMRKARREHHEEEKYDEGKASAMKKDVKSVQEVSKGTSQRTEGRENATVDQGKNKQKPKQERDKGKHKGAGKGKHGEMWGTRDQEKLDKENWGVILKNDQRRDHGYTISEEDWENAHGVQRNRDDVSSDKGWRRKSLESAREEESQIQEVQNSLELKEKEQGRGINGISGGQWKTTFGETSQNDQELIEQDLRNQGKGNRECNRTKWEAKNGEVKRETGSKQCEGRQEEQCKGEHQRMKFGRCEARENSINPKEGYLEQVEMEEVDKGMSDTRNATEFVWETEWRKRNERTCANEEPVGKKLYRKELDVKVYIRAFEESLKYLEEYREQMKRRGGGLEQGGTIEKQGGGLLNIKYSKEEAIGNERWRERKEEIYRKLKDYQKNGRGETVEVSADQEGVTWRNEIQGQMGSQKSQESSGEEQEYWVNEDGTAQAQEQDKRKSMAAQAWEGEKWPGDISKRQRGKTQEDTVRQKGLNEEAQKREGGQERLTRHPWELLIRNGDDLKEGNSPSNKEPAARGSENKEDFLSASHLCELAKITEKPPPVVAAGPENVLNNKGAQKEANQRWMRLSRSRKENLPWELQESISMAAWAPLDLPSLVVEYSLVPRRELFWKVLLILPGYDTCFACSPTRVLMDWLRTKFMGTKVSPQNRTSWSNERIETLCTLKSQRQKRNLTVDISICIKGLHGICTKEQLHKTQTQDSLSVLNGLILLLPTRRRGVCQESYWHLARLQLSQLLRAKPPQPLAPLVILVPTDSEALGEEEAKAGLRLRDLITSHLIPYFTILKIPCYIQDLEGSKQVQEAVRWLICYSPPTAELCWESFTHFMEKGINYEFGERLSRDYKDRQLSGLPSQEAGVILELYNSVIQFLAEVVSAKQLCGPSGMAPEFFRLNNQRCLQPQGSIFEYLEWLRSITLSLQLPPIVLPQKTSWQCICSSVLQYIYDLFGSHANYPLLHCQIEQLLSQTYHCWQTRGFGEQEEPSGMEVPWDVIICLCVQQLLQNWSPPRKPGAPEAVEHQGREIQVCYFKDSLRAYCLPDSWENSRLRTRREMLQHKKEQTL
ncbi:uncharacterized protein LOC141489120 isoform X2 [Macrotis lagotis]|uniref:uncharacterized protein LOC141489120 isoform X2 n=1 Tax=Macrotis lagotis TaxID=92651 RepID=UPI003D680B6C